jgi:hypothetical protein
MNLGEQIVIPEFAFAMRNPPLTGRRGNAASLLLAGCKKQTFPTPALDFAALSLETLIHI